MMTRPGAERNTPRRRRHVLGVAADRQRSGNRVRWMRSTTSRGHQVSESSGARSRRRPPDNTLDGTEVNEEAACRRVSAEGPATEVKGGTACRRRSAPSTEGHHAPSMWASDQEAMAADWGVRCPRRWTEKKGTGTGAVGFASVPPPPEWHGTRARPVWSV